MLPRLNGCDLRDQIVVNDPFDMTYFRKRHFCMGRQTEDVGAENRSYMLNTTSSLFGSLHRVNTEIEMIYKASEEATKQEPF